MPQDPRFAGPRPPFTRSPPAGSARAENPEPPPDHGETSYRGSGRLAGCAAIVTDGDSGVGRAVAIAFAREGADVAIGCLREIEGARDTAKWVTRAGRKAVVVPADLGSDAGRRDLVRRAFEALGRLDILVNHSAFEWAHALNGPSAASSPADIEQALRRSGESVFLLAQVAAEKMNPGGAIINTTPIHCVHPTEQQRAYASFGGSIVNLTASLAQLLVPRGIRVNAVAPGPVWSARTLASLPAEAAAGFGAETLLGRPAQPAELAPAYVFLASGDASFITGAVLPVTGGVSEHVP